jgi:hypothetical protein
MWKFFVFHVFHIAIHFHQFQSSQIPCRGLSQLSSPEQVLIAFCFQKALCSLPEMHFLAYAMLNFRTLIRVKNSMNGRRRVSPGPAKRLSGIDVGNQEGGSEKETKKQEKARAANEEGKTKPNEYGYAETGQNRGKGRKTG